MAARLSWVAHAPTEGTRRLVFGDQPGLSHPTAVPRWAGTVRTWACGPEPACLATVAAMGGAINPVHQLSDLDVGRWRGLPLAEVAARWPAELSAWLADADAAPHGGESIRHLADRVGSWLGGREWPAGSSVIVVTPLVARAAAVAALSGNPQLLRSLDVAPLARVVLTGDAGAWRLRLGAAWPTAPGADRSA